MITSSAANVNSFSQCDNTAWIDNALCTAFNELKCKIASKRKLHASEECNRDSYVPEFTESKIYDMINSYHSYCRLCDQHFYSRSVRNDINSFFQKHLNTSYHRQMRMVELPPDQSPMFTWELNYEFRRGRCKICNMSGLNSYILDTKLDTLRLMKLHICLWDKENRETNEKILRKLTLLKHYCGLTIFREILIKTINGVEVCLLCGVRLPWSKEKAICHLSSDGHYQNFCLFLQRRFNFAPKDVLNGFNLELVTRSLITQCPPPITSLSDCIDYQICLADSNSNENPYPEDKHNYSFSPKDLQLFWEKMNYYHNQSLAVNKKLSREHLESVEHLIKMFDLDENSFNNPSKYETYCKNRERRLRIIEIIVNLLGEEEPKRVESPVRNAAEVAALSQKQAQKLPSQVNYLKKLLKEKLELVSFIFTVMTDTEVFCHVCDEHVPMSREIGHLNSRSHKFHEERWTELRAKFEDEKFLEPFVRLKNLILCLVCGAVMMQMSFYSHLKGDAHRRRLDWYSGLNVSIPISSAFVFHKDFSCTCTICHCPLSTNTSFTMLKTTLKNIKYHWPCPKLKVTPNEPREIGETNKVEDVPQPGGDPKNDEKEENSTGNGLDFKKVERTVDSLVNVFEEDIEKNVLGRLEKCKMTKLHSGEELREVLQTDVRLTLEEEPSCGCDHHSECSCPAEPTGESEEKEVEEKFERIVLSDSDDQNVRMPDSNDQKTEQNDADQEQTGQEEPIKETETQEEEHEVLLIAGLPKSKRTYDIIYSKFNGYGKIRYVFFEGKHTILAFSDPGVAEIAAKNTDLMINDHKVTLTVSTRKARAKIEKPCVLHKDLVYLFQNPQRVMDFSLNLIYQAVAASESLAEKKREELVCNTIIAAIYEYYPQGRCYPFGSRLSGLTLNNSDLDVFLDCGGMYDGFKNTTPTAERRLVNKVAALLRKKREITDMVVVDRARVPIVSFLHKPTLLHCDLSFKNGLSIQNTLLIKFMMSLDWRVKPLILFLKHWAKLNDLHGPPNFSSYAIAMLVIFYLQQLECPILPTIESLQKNYTGPRRTIGGWDCSINMNISDVKQTDNNDPVPQLLAGLFKYYAAFNYGLHVISPLTGKLLPRKAFLDSDISELPMCYKRQILNIPPPLENLVSSKICMCIIDPFDLSHVLTKSITARNLQIFTVLCRFSEECLRKAMTVPVTPL